MIKYHDSLDLFQLHTIDKYQNILDAINNTQDSELHNIFNELCSNMLCTSSKQDIQNTTDFFKAINFSDIILSANIPHNKNIRQFIIDSTPHNNLSMSFEQFISKFIQNIIKTLDKNTLVLLENDTSNAILSKVLKHEIKNRNSLIHKLKQIINRWRSHDKK